MNQHSSLYYFLKITNPSELFDEERLWHMSVRANQGQIVSRVINYVPKNENYAYGETILSAVTASLIPRFLWPNKPRTGADMVCRFLGDCSSYKNGMSYNIGPIGESYVNFGPIFGVVFMFVYGLFMKYSYIFVLNQCNIYPRLLLWIPAIFIGFVFTMENDILSAINTLFKAGIFIYMLFWMFKLFFKIKL